MLFQIKKKRKDYSNTKVKTRNLLTNVFYRRFKQSNFKKDSFIIDILSYLLQKLEIEKERDIVKFLWDDCITQDFVRYMNKLENYVIISKPIQHIKKQMILLKISSKKILIESIY